MKLSETLTVGDLQERDYHCERTLQRVVILDDSAPQRGRRCERIPQPIFLFQCGAKDGVSETINRYLSTFSCTREEGTAPQWRQKDGVNDCVRNPQPIFLLLCGDRVRRTLDVECWSLCDTVIHGERLRTSQVDDQRH